MLYGLGWLNYLCPAFIHFGDLRSWNRSIHCPDRLARAVGLTVVAHTSRSQTASVWFANTASASKARSPATWRITASRARNVHRHSYHYIQSIARIPTAAKAQPECTADCDLSACLTIKHKKRRRHYLNPEKTAIDSPNWSSSHNRTRRSKPTRTWHVCRTPSGWPIIRRLQSANILKYDTFPTFIGSKTLSYQGNALLIYNLPKSH